MSQEDQIIEDDHTPEIQPAPNSVKVILTPETQQSNTPQLRKVETPTDDLQDQIEDVEQRLKKVEKQLRQLLTENEHEVHKKKTSNSSDDQLKKLQNRISLISSSTERQVNEAKGEMDSKFKTFREHRELFENSYKKELDKQIEINKRFEEMLVQNQFLVQTILDKTANTKEADMEQKFEKFSQDTDLRFSQLQADLSEYEEFKEIRKKTGNFLESILKEVIVNVNALLIEPITTDQKTMLNTIRLDCVKSKDFDSFTDIILQRFSQVNEHLNFTQQDINLMKTDFKQEFSEYLRKEDYTDVNEKIQLEMTRRMQQFVVKKDFDKLITTCESFATIDNARTLQKNLDSLKMQIADKHVTKIDLSRTENVIKQWTTTQYASNSLIEAKLNDHKQIMDRIIKQAVAVSQSAESQMKELSSLKDEIRVEIKATKKKVDDQIQEINDLMSKVALYQDFKDLYMKLMPNLEMVQKQMIKVSEEHEMNKQIISRLDENLSLCAQRHEILEYAKELRSFCRLRNFNEHQVKSEQFFEKFQSELDEITTYIKQRDKYFSESIRSQINQKILAFQAKQSKKDLNVTPDDIDQIKSLSSNITDLLKAKAEATDLISLREIKTNKQDTEQIMCCVEIIHRMIVNIAVLQIEQIRQMTEPNMKSQVSKEQSNVFLLAQAVNVGSWIKSFEPQNVSTYDYRASHVVQEEQDELRKQRRVSRVHIDPQLNITARKLPSLQNLTGVNLRSFSTVKSPTTVSTKFHAQQLLNQSTFATQQNNLRKTVDFSGAQLPKLRINQSSALEEQLLSLRSPRNIQQEIRHSMVEYLAENSESNEETLKQSRDQVLVLDLQPQFNVVTPRTNINNTSDAFTQISS